VVTRSCPKPGGGRQSSGTRGAPGAALCREAGAGAQATHDAPGAALSQEVGVGAVGTRGVPGAALTFVLTWSLYAGVPDPQGIDSMNSMHKNPSNR
jgi:hypothetical protein